MHTALAAVAPIVFFLVWLQVALFFCHVSLLHPFHTIPDSTREGATRPNMLVGHAHMCMHARYNKYIILNYAASGGTPCHPAQILQWNN